MDLRAIGLGLAFALMWSSAFTSARMIVLDAPPITALAVRCLFSGLLGIFIARAFGQTWKLSRVQWRSTFIFGVCQNALYLGFFFYAMQTIEASLAAIIAAAMPLFVGLAGWVGQPIDRRRGLRRNPCLYRRDAGADGCYPGRSRRKWGRQPVDDRRAADAGRKRGPVCRGAGL